MIYFIYFFFSLTSYSPRLLGRKINYNHCTPLLTNLCLAVEHSWAFCIGSCEPVHEDRTNFFWF